MFSPATVGLSYILERPLTDFRTAERDFIDAVYAVQGIELGKAEYDENQRMYAEESQRYQRAMHGALNADEAWIYVEDIDAGKVIKLVAVAVAGFFSGGLLFAAIAVVGSIIQDVTSSRQQRQQQKAEEQQQQEEERFGQTNGIRNGGSLATAGQLAPLIYGNRELSVDAEGNQHGGVRLGGLLIGSAILTIDGSNYLRQLWVLSVGQDAQSSYGAIAEVNERDILFDKQPRINFSESEIETRVRVGTQNQSAIADWFGEYTQNVSVDNYNLFGSDPSATVETFATSPAVSASNSLNAEQVGTTVRKTINTNVWDSRFWTKVAIANAEGTLLTLNVGAAAEVKAVGLSPYAKAVSFGDLSFGFYFEQGSTYQIVVDGEIVQSAGYAANDAFRIDNAGGVISLFRNSTVIYQAARERSPYYPTFLFRSPQSQFTSVAYTLGAVPADEATGRSVITVSAEDLANLATSRDYYLSRNNSQIGQGAVQLRVVNKDEPSRSASLNVAGPIAAGEVLYSGWIGKHETTKRVTSVEFNLALTLSARTTDGSKQEDFGVLFDVAIRLVKSIGDAEVLCRFFVQARSPATQYRSFRIDGLPLGRYSFEIQPRETYRTDRTIYELTDYGARLIVPIDSTTTPGNALQQITFQGVTLSSPGALGHVERLMRYDNKTQVSTRQGAAGRIASVNEMVSPAAIAINPADGSANRYPGLCELAIQYRASDRVTGSPGIGVGIPKGRTIPNLMAAGNSSGLSTSTVLNDPGADFDKAGVIAYWQVRNLSKGKDATITAVTPTTLQTSTALDWSVGDRYLVFFIGASPYLPDTAVDLATNPSVGAGIEVDRDQGIDYESFVAARLFCKRHKLFWNGIVDGPGQNIKQWLEKEARTSLLLPGAIDGRWAMFPDEVPDVAPHCFNASNARNFSSGWSDWVETAANRVIIRYEDGRDLFQSDGARYRTKTVAVETLGVHYGTEPPVEKVLDLPNIKTPVQAISVAVVALNSLTLQSQVIEFETSLQAAYEQGGKLIRAQSPLLETGEAFSGEVVRASEYVGGYQSVVLSEPPILFEKTAAIARINGATFVDANLGNTAVSVGDLLVNKTTGDTGVITVIAPSDITANVESRVGDFMQVLNLTASSSLMAYVSYQDGRHQSNIKLSLDYEDGAIWVKLTTLSQALSVGDIVNINDKPNLYRIQRMEPGGKSTFRISAVSHPGQELYERSRYVLKYDDKEIFPTDEWIGQSHSALPDFGISDITETLNMNSFRWAPAQTVSDRGFSQSPIITLAPNAVSMVHCTVMAYVNTDSISAISMAIFSENGNRLNGYNYEVNNVSVQRNEPYVHYIHPQMNIVERRGMAAALTSQPFASPPSGRVLIRIYCDGAMRLDAGKDFMSGFWISNPA